MHEADTSRPSLPEYWEIRVRGHLNDRWSERFEAVEMRHDPCGETIIVVRAPDQAALYGVLARLQALACPLISVIPAPRPPAGA